MPLETGLRVCRRAGRLARRAGLDVDGQRRVYYLALLRHIGCTADNAELAGLVGDELAFRSGMGTRDVSSGRALLPYLVQLTVGARPAAERPAALMHLLTHARVLQRAGVAVCEVAQMLLDRLGLDDALRGPLREDLVMVYERYDGHGFPHGLDAADISLPAQIVHLAEAVTLHLQLVGREGAFAMLRRAAGPRLPARCRGRVPDDAGPLTAESDDTWSEVLAMEPGGAPALAGDGRRRRARGDRRLRRPQVPVHRRALPLRCVAARRRPPSLRAPRRRRHARCAAPAGSTTSDGSRCRWRCGTSRGRWSATSWEQVRLHPYVTERVFARSPFLAPLAALAGAHHERVDGSGYHRAQGGAELSVPARILAAADVYAALVAERSHRPARTAAEAARALRDEASRAGWTPMPWTPCWRPPAIRPAGGRPSSPG